MPPTPVAAPWYGSTADGWLCDSILNATARPSPMSITPAFSPGPAMTSSPVVGSDASSGRLLLYEQCSLHMTLNIASSRSFGSRPRRLPIASSSSSVMPSDRWSGATSSTSPTRPMESRSGTTGSREEPRPVIETSASASAARDAGSIVIARRPPRPPPSATASASTVPWPPTRRANGGSPDRRRSRGSVPTLAPDGA